MAGEYLLDDLRCRKILKNAAVGRREAMVLVPLLLFALPPISEGNLLPIDLNVPTLIGCAEPRLGLMHLRTSRCVLKHFAGRKARSLGAFYSAFQPIFGLQRIDVSRSGETSRGDRTPIELFIEAAEEFDPQLWQAVKSG